MLSPMQRRVRAITGVAVIVVGVYWLSDMADWGTAEAPLARAAGTTTTTGYPFKWYSVASSTGSGAQYATTTEYVFNQDALVATIDQQLAGGTATGSVSIR
jgi:hypothetical protein